MVKPLEEGDIVLCTVDKILGTTVFLKLEEGGEGTMNTSEVAAGRIRNLRDYVFPGKRIVCKVLNMGHNINLSLRRVSNKEKTELMEKYEKERNILSILRICMHDKAPEVFKKIKEKEPSITEFFAQIKDNPSLLYSYIPEEESEKISCILREKKEKDVEVRKEFSLSSKKPNGMELIKQMLIPHKAHVSYLAAGRFVIKVKAQDYKKANAIVNEIISDLEKKSKHEKADFEIKEK